MHCIKCQIEISRGRYCSNKCQIAYQRSLNINLWLNGQNFIRKGGTSIPNWIRHFLLEETNNSCSLCGWSKINEFTHNSPLEIDHIDGDAYNNTRVNLRVLCPNCHSLTETFKNTGSRVSTRRNRQKF